MSFCLYNKKEHCTAAWGYEFYFLVAKTIFYEGALVLPLENKIHIFAPPCKILYLHSMLHKSAFRFTDIYIQGMGKYSPLILRLSNGKKSKRALEVNTWKWTRNLRQRRPSSNQLCWSCLFRPCEPRWQSLIIKLCNPRLMMALCNSLLGF